MNDYYPGPSKLGFVPRNMKYKCSLCFKKRQYRFSSEAAEDGWTKIEDTDGPFPIMLNICKECTERRTKC